MIRVWEAATGEALTCIEPPADVNDVALYSDSGLLFAALEAEKLGVYFVPALGPAPRWCHFIDALSEEMEEQATGALYDDYKFVRREELTALGLDALVGTSVLRPYMHGFFIDARLHAKAASLSQPFAYEQWRKERVAAKLEAKSGARIAPRARVKVNAELASELQRARAKATPAAQGASAAGSGAEGVAADAAATGAAAPGASLLHDRRFASLFSNPDFAIDTAADEYHERRPHGLDERLCRDAENGVEVMKLIPNSDPTQYRTVGSSPRWVA